MHATQKNKKQLNIKMAAPRGFCAGVDRAIDIVEQMLKLYGKPVYVRHEIVHNSYVVSHLKERGAVFVDEIDQAPNDRPIVFSAHGVPKAIPQMAQKRNMHYVDATCPLVSKVHREAESFYQKDYTIILIGHRFHPEVEGTMGQLPTGAIHLVENNNDVDTLKIDSDKIAYLTQTTLSVDDTSSIIAKLKKKFPYIQAPKKNDICYATTNRQQAVKQIAPDCDLFLIIGSNNSSNSRRLVDVALNAGSKKAFLIEDVHALEQKWLAQISTLGISAGASAPEYLVTQLLDYLNEIYDITVSQINSNTEDVTFRLPPLTKHPSWVVNR